MMFDEEELKLLLEFYNHCYNFTPEYEEMSGWWSQSYYTYECIQGLILGKERYEEHPWPKWLDTKPTYRTQGPIRHHIKSKIDIYNLLNGGLKDVTGNLLICEAGYGLDLIVAMMTRTWDSIKAYDHNPQMGIGLKKFFVDNKKLNLEFETKSSDAYDFAGITEPTIMIASFTHITVAKKGEEIRSNDNIIYVRNGAVIDKGTIILDDLPKFRKRFKGGFL